MTSFFDLRNAAISDQDILSNTNVRDRESRALIIVKLGFSVVAPIRMMIHFSTKGSRASCWALFHRWISSRKTIVGIFVEKFFFAFAMILVRSSFLLVTQERW